eukprot:COSAG02_NODE_3137_length_7298_cov_48.676344_5_plen_181_part_01
MHPLAIAVFRFFLLSAARLLPLELGLLIGLSSPPVWAAVLVPGIPCTLIYPYRCTVLECGACPNVRTTVPGKLRTKQMIPSRPRWGTAIWILGGSRRLPDRPRPACVTTAGARARARVRRIGPPGHDTAAPQLACVHLCGCQASNGSHRMADQPEYPGADAWGDCDCAQSSTTSWAMSGVR